MNPSSVSESIYNTTRLEGESGLYARPPESTSVSDASRYMQQARAVPEEDQPKTFTIDEALEHFGFGRTQVLMFFFCGMAWAGDGMEMMLLSYLGPEVRHAPIVIVAHNLARSARCNERVCPKMVRTNICHLGPSAGPRR